MFRVFLQENELILRSLVGALLHLEQEEIVEINILNPIEVGAAITNKEFVLDTRILLNSNVYLNLEMQVSNKGNWTDRSLLYLCRSYDNLEKGGEYEDVLPAIHVGILDYTLFPEEPEFPDSTLTSSSFT
jgi:predicted transposase/invertase (TIGR01784 family)